MFSKETFEQYLTTSWLGRSFYCYDELSSTNNFAKEIKKESSLHGAIILADHQTDGRGQHGRKWEVELGQNLTFSLVFEPKKNERFTLLTLACALAVADYITKSAGVTVKLKWPNDVLYNNQKLCGILTETQFSGNKLERIIVGIGLNVNQQKFGHSIHNTATSLSIITSQTCIREKILAEILLKIEYNYRLWSQYNPELVKQINHALIGYGEWVKLQVNNGEMEGKFKFLGVNEAGALVVLNQELEVQTFAYEEIRIYQIDSENIH